MSEIIVTKEKMESLKVLAETNMAISEARNALFKLQELETEYLITREKKALDRIQKVLDESNEVINQIKINYLEVHELLGNARDMASFMIEAHNNFKKLLTDFKERDDLWHEQCDKKRDEFENLRKALKIDSVMIANSKKSMEKEKIRISEDRTRVDNDREELKRAIIRLKEGKI